MAALRLRRRGALRAHGLKARDARRARTPRPEPVTNWMASFAEDGLTAFLLLLAVKYPLAAAPARACSSSGSSWPAGSCAPCAASSQGTSGPRLTPDSGYDGGVRRPPLARPPIDLADLNEGLLGAGRWVGNRSGIGCGKDFHRRCHNSHTASRPSDTGLSLADLRPLPRARPGIEARLNLAARLGARTRATRTSTGAWRRSTCSPVAQGRDRHGRTRAARGSGQLPAAADAQAPRSAPGAAPALPRSPPRAQRAPRPDHAQDQGDLALDAAGLISGSRPLSPGACRASRSCCVHRGWPTLGTVREDVTGADAPGGC